MAWVQLQGMDSLGRLLELEVKVKRDVVEWWLEHRSVAMMDRERLSAWLRNPQGTFATHDVRLWVSHWGPVIEIDGTPQPAILDSEAFTHLQAQVQSDSRS